MTPDERSPAVPASEFKLTADDVLTVSDVCALLHTPKSTVEALARRGDLPSFIVGRRRLFSRSHLERHIEAQIGAAA
jgi:excisionase family DNA binding protein